VAHYALSLHDALPIYFGKVPFGRQIMVERLFKMSFSILDVSFDAQVGDFDGGAVQDRFPTLFKLFQQFFGLFGAVSVFQKVELRSEEHTSELQSRENL